MTSPSKENWYILVHPEQKVVSLNYSVTKSKSKCYLREMGFRELPINIKRTTFRQTCCCCFGRKTDTIFLYKSFRYNNIVPQICMEVCLNSKLCKPKCQNVKMFHHASKPLPRDWMTKTTLSFHKSTQALVETSLRHISVDKSDTTGTLKLGKADKKL